MIIGYSLTMETKINPTKSVDKPKLVNNIKKILSEKELTNLQLKAKIIAAGLSENVYYRMLREETSFTTTALAKIANQLDLDSIADLVDIQYP